MERQIPSQVLRQQEEIDAWEASKADPPAPPPEDTTQDPTPPVTPPAEQAKPPEPDAESWRQRYLTLQGMFNSEVPRLNEQVRALQGQISDLTRQLESAKRPQEPSTPSQRLVTDKDAEAFGTDLLDVISRAVKDGVAEAEAKFAVERGRLEAEITKLSKGQQGVQQHVEQSNRQAYFQALGNLVPDYEAVNVHPGFLEYMAEVDPIVGVPRQRLLEDAFAKFDSRRTAAIFNAWKATQAPPATPASQPAPQRQLERQTQPGNNRSSVVTPPTVDDTKVWRADEIDRFYRDVGKGKYVGREAEAARIEAAIDRAAAEGRLAK